MADGDKKGVGMRSNFRCPIVPSTSKQYKRDKNLTANPIHNDQISINRGKGIKCHQIPKVLSKMRNLGDPKIKM